MPEPLDPTAWRPAVRGRLLFVAIAFAAWAAVIEGRLVYLQVYDHEHLKNEAIRQQLQTIDMPAQRGDLYDRHGRLLAYSVDADSVCAVPAEVKSAGATLEKLCEALDGCTAKERSTLQRRFATQNSFAYVRRYVTPDQARRVMGLDLPGVFLMKEPKRFYPNRELAANVLGYVGLDDKTGRQKGLGGLEARYDAKVRGRDSKLLVEKVSTTRELRRVGDPPVPGASLELTIDQTLQHIAERELRAGVQANRAAGGVVVIIDPNTGEILAMASEPSFNPNEYGRVDEDSRRNRAVQDSYEPGSTFKMITATAGLQERVVTPDTWIDTGNGILKLGYRVVRDTHPHYTIPFRDVIALSSNIGS
ncbi:MAG: penicillin-binding protein 2, partial [Acidobacteria bacterium]